MKGFVARFTPYAGLSGWLRGLAIAVAAALFLTVSGAFDTGAAPLAARAAYWLSLMTLGCLFGPFIARLFFRRPALSAWPGWLRVVVASLLMAAPFTVVVWAGSVIFLREALPPAAWPVLFLSVWSVALAITAINLLVESRRTDAPTAAQPPRFLERLPLRLRGAEVWAVEAEDHYLRLHTSKGQDLILLRLADAVAELEGLEGAQVHRSWWVARDAIADARRGDGRATLTLKDGSQVPVSRSYARTLRERGWI